MATCNLPLVLLIYRPIACHLGRSKKRDHQKGRLMGRMRCLYIWVLLIAQKALFSILHRNIKQMICLQHKLFRLKTSQMKAAATRLKSHFLSQLRLKKKHFMNIFLQLKQIFIILCFSCTQK